MFPSALIRRVADNLLEAADVMLRPGEEPAPRSAHEGHPHRRPLVPPTSRRGGTIESRPQPCTSPVSPRERLQRPETHSSPSA